MEEKELWRMMREKKGIREKEKRRWVSDVVRAEIRRRVGWEVPSKIVIRMRATDRASKRQVGKEARKMIDGIDRMQDKCTNVSEV